MSVTIKAKALEALVADIFSAVGWSKEEGGRIGRYLVSANLSGHDSHGTRPTPGPPSSRPRARSASTSGASSRQ